MNKEELIKISSDFVNNSEDNIITEENAISKAVVGMKIFEAPIFGFASAEDEYFKRLKEPFAIGTHFLLPNEWLQESKTVISFFLPFTEAVRDGNRKDMFWPSDEWLHGRIEGQAFLNKFLKHLKSILIDCGYSSIAPSLDERFWSKSGFKSENKENEVDFKRTLSFTSNWSESHVAFVCGLGTFGLSKGIITPKGMAGRLGSIITELDLEPDKREYENIYDYCSMCGRCVKNCPANAISIIYGKNHDACSNFLDKTAEKYKPRYGCGKCQINVPCESNIPKAYN